MLVEDNAIYRELLRDLCQAEGHEVHEAGTAEDALRLLRSLFKSGSEDARRIDLFVTDFNMDKMNGYELVRQLRQFPETRGVPVLMISSTDKKMDELLRVDGVGFLKKPCANAVVMSTIEKLLPPASRKPKKPAPPPKTDLKIIRDPLPGVSLRDDEEALPSFPKHKQPAKRRGPAQPAPAPILPPAPPPKVRGAPATPPVPAAASPTGTTAGDAAASHTPPPVVVSLPNGPVASEPPAPPPPAAPAVPAPPPLPAPAAKNGSSSSPENELKSLISQSKSLSSYFGRKKGDAEAHEGEGAGPVTEILEKVLDAAVHQAASDIHIEPQPSDIEIRVRVDGALQPFIRLPLSLRDTLTARVKIVANLNITEKRLPQDGQFARQGADGRLSKFRVSTLPSLHGEKIVIRVLPSESQRAKLDGLGLSAAESALVQRVLRSPNGLILVTGPTGSGKTSTLYTMVDELNSRHRNIVTVEDPIEYQMPGITQVQVNPQIGYTVEAVLRAFLRQDPNVMLVGEIRDKETAEICLKAAVTGHVVLSTLHTNDAASAVHRLLSMGVPAYLLAAGCRLIVAQRLLRVLCPGCREESRLTPDEASLLAPEEAARLSRVWRPRGCGSCHGRGYAGRVPVFELLPVLTHAIRTAVAKEASPEDIKNIATREGMTTMRRAALGLVANGATSFEEALSVLYV